MKTTLVTSTEADRIYFHTPGRRASAYPYQMLGAGNAVKTVENGLTSQRFHQHVFIHTTGGAGKISVRDGEFLATPGSVSWVDTSLVYAHGCHARSSTWQYHWMGIQGYRLSVLMDTLDARQDPIFHPGNSKDLRMLFAKVSNSLRDRANISDSHLNAAIARLIESLAKERAYLKEKKESNDWYGRLIEKMLADLSRKWTMTAMAKACNKSPSQVFRVFRERAGATPMEWLRGERINVAKSYLIQSDAGIAKVALQCGYNDPYHFSRIFKKIVGMSPVRFRQAWEAQTLGPAEE